MRGSSGLGEASITRVENPVRAGFVDDCDTRRRD